MYSADGLEEMQGTPSCLRAKHIRRTTDIFTTAASSLARLCFGTKEGKTVEEERKAYSKPPLGARPRWLNDWARLQELAGSILQQANNDNEQPNYALIKPWAEEIVDICDNAEYGKHEH